MHIPDGFVSNGINVAVSALSLGSCWIAARLTQQRMEEREIPLMGMTAAFIFASQMVNFPVTGGTSGHMVGAVLAAILLGPWACCLIMALVLTAQCLLFADGGLTALGINIFNLGVLGGLGGYGILRILQGILPQSRGGILAATSLTAWLSVILAAAACSLELVFSGTAPLKATLPLMLGVHSIIGVGEAVITASIVSFLLTVRPDLLKGLFPEQPPLLIRRA
jgi:cobalt/nickel transport system permease protein